ncbi:multidrug effflux MFS transporter [Ornithinimicrobium flavum]|uniref:multidrug effflux MFS transporter n=1 Tax=Ornithinimicrobium flavum TaxID=1288636 RepID=UPI001EE79459|nr:multidrug effflux MFS transporter [Ornithinimicrobium flavum]
MTSSARAGWLVTVVLASLAMIGPFTIDTIFPGFEAVGRDFDVDATALQQLTSTYLLAFALMSVLHGPLSDALGRKPVMIGGLAGFTAACVVAATAPTFGVLLGARVAQGLFAGAATIVSRAVIRDLFDGPEAQRLMARVMMIFAVAPAVAPVIGGEILRFASWHAIFWFVGLYAVAAAALTALVLPETLPPQDRTRLRVGAVVGGLWQVARSWPFERLALCSALAFGSYFVYVVGAPIVVVDLLGLGEQDFWVLFVPMIGGMVVGSWLTNRLAGRLDGRVLVDRAMAGLLLAGVANLALTSTVPTLPWAWSAPRSAHGHRHRHRLPRPAAGDARPVPLLPRLRGVDGLLRLPRLQRRARRRGGPAGQRQPGHPRPDQPRPGCRRGRPVGLAPARGRARPTRTPRALRRVIGWGQHPTRRTA